MELNICHFWWKKNELREKHNEIWKKYSNSIKKGFPSETLCNEKYAKSKIKSYKEKIKTNCQGDKILKEGFQWICLTIILTDSICENYYP